MPRCANPNEPIAFPVLAKRPFKAVIARIRYVLF
jgi:hypothetical protein